MHFIKLNEIKDEERNLILSVDEYKLFLTEIPFEKRIPRQYFDFITSKNENDVKYEEIKPFLSKKLQDSLFDFQKNALCRMVTQRRIINSSYMGCGKTIQSLAALSFFMKEAGMKRTSYLIICPSNLKTNWANEFQKWEIDVEVHIIDKIGNEKNYPQITKKLLFQPGVKIIGFELASNIFEKLSKNARNRSYFNSIIIDESHNLKNVKSKRFKMLQCVITKAQNVLLLSGTAMPNRNKELFPQLKLLYPSVFSNYEIYQKRYCDLKIDPFTQFIDDRGSSNLEELSLIFSRAALRIRMEDFSEEMPNVIRSKEELDINLSEEYEDLKTQLDECENQNHSSFIISSLFRETALIKAKALEDYFEWLDVDEKIICFYFHQVSGEAIKNGLTKNGEDFVFIDGSVSMKKRDELIQKLLYGNINVGVFSYCMSTGVNLTPIRKTFFCELCWSIAELTQAECRTNRIGGAKNIEYIYLCGKQSIDDQIFRTLEKKKNISNIVVDNGKEYEDFKFKKRKIQ